MATTLTNGRRVAVEAVRPKESGTPLDAYRTSGTSPTSCTRRGTRLDSVHLLGVGAVGRAFLERLASSRRTLLAVTDSTATIHDPRGIDALAIAAWKSAGRPLCEHPLARPWSVHRSIREVPSDVVVDATSSEPDRDGWVEALDDALHAGAYVVLAAKGALCDAGSAWLNGPLAGRIGCNAVLGGTGLRFTRELTELRDRWTSVAIVGNASTTAIIEAVERGATVDEGIAAADRFGFLEPDPELDLRGADAAVKLAIVAGVLLRRRIDPHDIPCEDIRHIDLHHVRERARRNATTRLVARVSSDGTLRIAYEELSRDSVLAVRCTQVIYDYRLGRHERRLHVGGGLGSAATAAAIWDDLAAFASGTQLGTPSLAGAR